MNLLDGETALLLLTEGLEKRKYSSPLVTDASPLHMIARWDNNDTRQILFIRWTPTRKYYCRAVIPSGIAEEARNNLSVNEALDWLGDKLCPSV